MIPKDAESNTEAGEAIPVGGAKKWDSRRIFKVFLVLIIILFTASQTKMTNSDSRSAMLVSQAMIQHGTVKLDQFDKSILDNNFTVVKNGPHYYYYFPIGTSLFSLPFVGLCLLLGFDMPVANEVLQIVIAVFVGLMNFYLMCRLAGRFLEKKAAVLLSGAVFFGSSLASTCGTALWSHNFAVLFGFVALNMYVENRASWKWEMLLGVVLFCAYLCRPTMALFAVFLGFGFFAQRGFYRTVLMGCGFLAGLAVFCLFNLHEFGQILPDYYLPQRLSGGDFYTALRGNLWSPSRGILLYIPFLVPLIPTLFFRETRRELRSWWLVCLAWPVVHLILISRFPHWWAGWCYGPRLMTDVMPGLFILVLIVWKTTFDHRIARRAIAAALVLSVAIHTGQGLGNFYAKKWNALPNVDLVQETLWDWEYPQMLHTKSRHEMRIKKYSENPYVIEDLKRLQKPK